MDLSENKNKNTIVSMKQTLHTKGKAEIDSIPRTNESVLLKPRREIFIFGERENVLFAQERDLFL